MKHYTSQIPPTLAEKLKEKGMPMITSVSISIVEDKPVVDENGEQWYCPMFCEVFDWFATRGIYISICHRETSVGIEWYPIVNEKCPYAIDGREWHHSAEKAIEKALTLI